MNENDLETYLAKFDSSPAIEILTKLKEKFPKMTDEEIMSLIDEHRNSKAKSKDSEDGIRATPDSDLLIPKQEAEEIISDVRDIVSGDPFFIKIRNSLKFKIPELEFKEVKGEPHVVIYRNINVNYEEAAIASGLCKNRGNKGESLAKDSLKNQTHKIKRYFDEISGKHDEDPLSFDNPGRKYFEKTVGDHMAESDHSLFVPASTFGYAKRFGNEQVGNDGKNKILELTVPLKYLVPVYWYAEAYMNQYQDEKELAIAGKIEKEWIRVVDEKEFSELEEAEKID